MEMSAFARHEGSLPVIGDIGKIWPVMAYDICCALGIKLDFLSASQDTPEGQAMRDWIVANVKPMSREKMLSQLRIKN
jgi:prophage antirepressor-like protein